MVTATIVAVFLVLGGLLLFLGGHGAEGLARILLGCVFFVTSSENLAVWPRDLVLMRHRHRLSDKTTVIGLKSVVDETCPPRNSWLMVRGNITGGGFIIQGLANGKTRVSFVSQANFGGWAGVYGSYGMHVEQMALLISLKNHVHAEVAVVAGPSSSVVASPSLVAVTNGFDAENDEPPPPRLHTPNEQNSLSPATGFFMADISSTPKLTEVVSQTPDPFRSKNVDQSFVRESNSGGSKSNHATRLSDLSPVKRPLNHVLLTSDLGDSEEDPISEVGKDKLSSFPLRVWYDVPRPPQYAEQAMQNRELALRVSQEGPADGWVQVTTSKGVQVWQKKMGDGKPNMVRGVLLDVPCSPGYFLSFSGSAERANWDPMCAKGHLVEVIDDFCTVTYERYHPIFPTSGRDFVVLNSIVKRPDGSYLRSAVSVEHPDCPEVSGVVRANLLFACFLVTSNASTGNCDVQYTLYVDLKGSIPAWIVARVATDQPLSLAGLRDFIIKHEDTGEPVRADPLMVRRKKIFLFFKKKKKKM
jgi:hypothetical protein